MQNETLLTPARADDNTPPRPGDRPPDLGPVRAPARPTGGGPSAPAVGERDPYPGLRPFRTDESDIFFGRESQTDEMVRRLKTSRFLAVVGTSGCGKSSLVRAGLIAALETGLMGIPEGARWRFAVMRPGGKPMYRLAAKLFDQAGMAPDGIGPDIGLGLLGARLRRGPLGLVEALQASPLPAETNLLVVVDQFEEIFRFRREGDINEADAFVALLLASAEQTEFPVYVVLTMRSDFMGECAVFEGLPEAINQSQYLTPRLSREQRRLAIVGPARASGGDITPDLVVRLLNETGGGPDQLPVLQHLLMRMWTSKVRAASAGQPIVLTMQDYDQVGGLEHALSWHADEIYNGLADDQRRCIAEVMFRKLSESPSDIRRPTEAGEIARIAATQVDAVATVADAFRAPGANFLMPEPGEAIEAATKLDISHESLIKLWQRLRVWASDEARIAETYRDLERTAQRNKRGESELLTGLDLQQALLWRRQCNPSREWAARYGGDFDLAMTFLGNSEAEANRRKAEKDAARRKALWFWRKTAAALFLLFILSVALGWLAVAEQQAAAEQRARVIASEARAALKNGDSRIALLAALDALPTSAPQAGDVADMLRWPLDPAKDPPLRTAFDAVVQSPLDGPRYAALLAASWDALRSPVDTQSYRAIRDWLRPLRVDALTALEHGVFRPFGRIFDNVDDTAPVVALAVSGATKMLVTATEKGIIQRWQWTDEAGWKRLAKIAHPSLIRSAGAPSAATTHPGLDKPGLVKPGAVAPAAGAPAGSAPAGYAQQQVQQQVRGVAFSADGRLFATITDWHQATVWDAHSGEPITRWSANRQGIPPTQQSSDAVVAFAADPNRPNHHRILTASYVSDAIIWGWDEAVPGRDPKKLLVLEDPALAGQPPGQRTHRSGVTTLAWSGDGRRAVTGSWDGTAKVWDAATGDLLYILDNGSPVRLARFSPKDSGRLVTAGNDGNLRLWCTHPGVVAEAAPKASGTGNRERPPTQCVPVADGGDATSADADPTETAARSRPRPRPTPPVTLEPTEWDTLSKHDREASSAVFDPRGERIASAGLDGTVRLWDVASGAMQDVLQGPAKVSGRYALVAFLDEQHLVASFSDGRAFLWTVASSPLRPRAMPAIADIRTAAIDAQDRRLATVGVRRTPDGTTVEQVEVWNLANATATAKPVRTLRPGREPVTRIAFSPDGGQLLTVSGNTVELWNANLWKAAGDDKPLASLVHGDRVLSIAFDADGRRLVSISADQTARVWDARTGRPLAPPLVHDAPVTAVAFDGAGKRVVTATAGTARIWDARIWDARTGSQTRALLHGAPVVTAAFDATGERLATVAENGFVRLWRVNDGSVVDTIGGLPPATGGGPVATTITMDADVIYIVRAPAAGVPRAWTWDIARKTLENDDTWPISARHRLHVRPDNGIEVTNRSDWGGPLALLPPLRDPLTEIVVSPDGGYLAAFYGKGQVRVMRLPESDPKEFIRYAREKVVPLLDQPELSGEERRRLGLGG